MKIILNILIVVVKFCASDSSVYDWHVRTIEHDSDFGNDFKVQTALNNERQQDLLKISGKTNNIDYYPDSYNQIFNKDIDDNDHKKNFNFDEHNQNILNDKIAIKYEDKSDFKSIFERKRPQTKNNKYNYGNINVNNFNDDLFYLSDKQTVRPNSFAKLHKSFLKSNRNFNDNNNTNINYEVEDKQILANNKNGKILEENEKVPLIRHFSGNNVGTESFVGTNLFDSTAKRCFSTDEVALLAARKDFENLIPKDLPQSLFNDHMVAMLLNYFYISHQIIIQTTSIGSRHLSEKAFYDTFGGFLNFYMVPVTKYSYYAGQISLSTAQQVLILHQESKQFLNTNGNGWKAPLENVLIELKSDLIEPLHISDLCNEPLFCSQLNMNTDENQPNRDEMIIQLPKLDAENKEGFLGNIWLPFRGKRTFDLKSDSSAYIIVKFYETVTKCYRFENIDQEFYNRQFKTLLLENIITHLSDEEFYPGLGAVLRIKEYLKRQIKDSIGISNDLELMANEDGRFKKQETINQLLNKRTQHNKSDKKLNKLNNQNNFNLTKDIVDQQPKAISEEDTQQKTALQTESTSFKIKLRTLDLTPTQIAVVAIPVVAIILVIIICCCKSFCKKKKIETQLKPKKNSSSSSSNLLNSPVRFFHVRKKSASGNTTVDYSSNEAGNKKIKKSVKIEKKPLLHSDSSLSISPIRNKKSKESTGSKDKAKNKDSGKSNV